MDEARPNPSNGGTPQIAIPVHQGSGPALERGSLNPNAPKFGRRRRTRSSQSENQGSGAEDEWMGGSVGSANSYGQSPVLGGGSSGMLSSSPRSPGSRGSYVVRAGPSRPKQPNGRQQNIPRKDSPSRPVTTAKSPGTARRQASRGRNRTSSETERGGKGSRGPAHRKRGLSETECRPKWDNTNMSGVQCLAAETIWFDKQRYDDAETRFYEGPNGPSIQETEASAILQEIAKSRQNIQQCLDGAKTALQPAKARPQKRQHRNSSNAGGDHELISRMKSLELENQGLHKVVEDMRAALQKLESRVAVLEKSPATGTVPCAKAAPVQQAKVENGDDDDDDDDDNDDIDLFGSDEEADAAAERLKEKRLEEYAAKKAKKPALIAKSSILLDVKPWDDETDMAKLEECVRSVEADGLLWGASKLLPVGYGIKKLQINCVVEDDKVGTDMLEEEITKFEDYVQSVDVAAFNKI